MQKLCLSGGNFSNNFDGRHLWRMEIIPGAHNTREQSLIQPFLPVLLKRIVQKVAEGSAVRLPDDLNVNVGGIEVSAPKAMRTMEVQYL